MMVKGGIVRLKPFYSTTCATELRRVYNIWRGVSTKNLKFFIKKINGSLKGVLIFFGEEVEKKYLFWNQGITLYKR
jgi:hypothetical protein